MTQESTFYPNGSGLPNWVPEGAFNYLEHTEAGQSIRALSRKCGCHASTVLRQIRRIEARRDDPLVDAALRTLGARHFASPETQKQLSATSMEPASMTVQSHSNDLTPDAATLSREARRILRRLCETGAVLAVAADMEKAVVVRDGADGSSTRTAVADSVIAQAMALKDWIACDNPGRISRYRITQTGRSALSRMLAEHESQMRQAHDDGFAEAQTPFGAQHRNWDEKEIEGVDGGRSRKIRYNLAESPLTALARRKDKDGSLFLSDELMTAGERLREDFELAQMGPRVAQNWEKFLTGGARGGFNADNGTGTGPEAARDRVAKALADLGPGLSDVVLRCCCFPEGLEMAEKKHGVVGALRQDCPAYRVATAEASL